MEGDELSLRIPPHSVEAEAAVLGGLLLDNTAVDRVADLVRAPDFYRADHRLVYEAILRLLEDSRPADVVTVFERLASLGQAQEVGGLAGLNRLAESTPSAANIRRYAEIVRDRSILRNLVTIADGIATTALNPEGRDARQILDEAESKIFKISEEGSRGTGGIVPFHTLVDQVVRRVDELAHQDNPSDVTGIPSGFIDLDQKTAGLHGGDLVIVAGRPSMGKTSFALNVGEHVAVDQGLPIAVFSMEMGAEQLALRVLCSVGRLDAQRIRTGRLQESEWDRLTLCVEKLRPAQIHIDETPGLNPLELRARARRLARQSGGLGLIIVDYIQLMSGTGGGENRTTEISEITRSLKGLAKELNCPVIALSQLNRTVEQRADKRPVMSDLRECVVGDTGVYLADGTRVAIRDLVGKTPDVLSASGDGRLECSRSDLVWSVGHREVFAVQLESGRQIRCTAQHRLLTPEGWKRLEEMLPQDRIAIARRLPEPREAVPMSGQELVDLALAVGNGSGLEDQRSADRRIPESVFRLGTEQLTLFIRHLWAAAGSIDQGLISFSSSSRGVADDLSMLLLRVGVVSRIVQSADAVHELQILSAANRQAFLEQIEGDRHPPAACLKDEDAPLGIASSDLAWDRIDSIESRGEQEVFDLTVPGNASWIADGIVSHNSGAIEQDADVILFIYRDEVYNKDTPDKGVAEIIIGKQRNGPIGTVRLTFLGQYTKFDNHAPPAPTGYGPQEY